MLKIVTAILCVGALHAHEIGTSRVSVLFEDGRTYNIEIVTDATALAEKLQLPATTNTSALQTLLAASDEKFRRRVKIAFDAAEVRSAITYSVEPPIDAFSATAATIRLTGQIPPGARDFTWTFGWTFASYALMVRNAPSDNPITQWLEGGDPSKPFALASRAPRVDRLQTAWRYLRLGFTHIVPNGLDHMLFVLGIYLLSRRPRSVLLQVSAFTVAHSITLGLSMYGVITVSPKIVEPMIALSIAYVAIENIFLAELKSWRVALVFAFGLLHGMGFAGALKELGLPRSEFVTALLTFNIGVEVGQLAVIATAFMLVGWHYSGRTWYRDRIVVPVSAMIACTAVYWTIQRLSI
jgi:hydrogenase/urease accessory protein HupE